jgi:hypothetical protein
MQSQNLLQKPLQKALLLVNIKCPHEIHYFDCNYIKQKIKQYSEESPRFDEKTKIRVFNNVIQNLKNNKYSTFEEYKRLDRKAQLKFLIKDAIKNDPGIHPSIKRSHSSKKYQDKQSLSYLITKSVLQGGKRKKNTNKNKRKTKKKF